jgi:hypothetical protein
LRPAAFAVVPTQIDHLVADPSLARTLPRPLCVSLLAVLIARLAEPDPAVVAPAAPDESDDGLTTKEAAKGLKMGVTTLLRAKHEEPYCQFLIPMGTKKLLRWSRRRIEAHKAKNPGPLKRGSNRRTGG